MGRIFLVKVDIFPEEKVQVEHFSRKMPVITGMKKESQR